MQYLKVNNDQWVEINAVNNGVRLVSKLDTERLIKQEEDWLKKFNGLTDKDLLSWAKENHPTYKDKQTHLDTKSSLESLLTNLK